MIFRLYWLGPATEPGLWAIDSGVGSRVWRVHTWSLAGIVSCKSDPTAPPERRPRGWIEVLPEHNVKIYAPQGEFFRDGRWSSEPDPIETAYDQFGVLL